MRLILTILLIGLLKADAQIVINASAPYRPMAVAGIQSGFSAGYSLRKLRNDYTGSAIRIRKDTTGQPEQDIGFTASGDLDTGAIKTFLNARNGFVVTWMDQSGNGRDATQATQANQPRIANLGVIDRDNGKPCVRFDASNDYLSAPSTLADLFEGLNNPISIFAVASNRSLTGNSTIFGLADNINSTAANNDFLYNYIAATNGRNIGSFRIYITTAITKDVTSNPNNTNANTMYLFTWIKDNTNGISYVNQNSGTLTDQKQAKSITLHYATIGALLRGTTPTIENPNRGNISEIVLYNTDQSIKRSEIFSNINSYYGIY